MEKLYLNPEEYRAVVAEYRSRYGYDEMSDEEKEAFDNRLDQVAAQTEGDGADAPDPSEASDSSGGDRSDADQLRGELKRQYGYDGMSEEQKQAFDERLDEALGAESSGDEDPPEQPQKVLRRLR